MRVPAILHADHDLFSAMDDKIHGRLVDVTDLPGIVQAAYATPDAHWGYGFPIGGVLRSTRKPQTSFPPGGVGSISLAVYALPPLPIRHCGNSLLKQRLRRSIF